MNSALNDLLIEAARLLFLGLLPIVGIVCLGSFVGTVIQASMAIQENTLSFGCRFLAFLLALYIFMPSIISSLLQLAQMAFGS